MTMITKDMSIMEIVQNYPRAREILVRYGMGCGACLGASLESLEKGAKIHKVDLTKLLAELNEVENK
ncbi:DUF1858 domain-containing protein [Thermanaerosceptrum fracticalcis]|uniref:DUF1858 domain-containing protein n=2 Tax=Thermanaerosceptrum fracticalcis TaxID=1712410 RepID=A0A7G6E1L3_THEFR|nr:DUF1858 domain-containing protein [Thermanaerosceptrum fracticalcis]QNB45967.1 DUF1858 domain-containing protein [Thermanaerosceptrum fracticalcis]